MNTYTIKIKEAAEKRLKRYDKEIQRRFASKIRKLSENPEVHGKPLRKPLHGYWELRFERRFRIIYTINHAEKTVTIEAIKHKDEF
ncbi:MAG: plasmid stabilization system [Candidatus Syntrophoarchaeum caldarius]|uniref:Plasmid stabilization system n=1 Tax=Candidatus Syntropharchaeum caldarium TaxID=1838285 RepID=A0A1F2P9Q1_9EURY|nr:MAG: plasmid stabilization system [Candidatus Syntrophoarchaeum caldarius]